jgi:hypothetical protein
LIFQTSSRLLPIQQAVSQHGEHHQTAQPDTKTIKNQNVCLLLSSQMVKPYYPLRLSQQEKARNISAFSITRKIPLPGSPIGQFRSTTKFFGIVTQARVG